MNSNPTPLVLPSKHIVLTWDTQQVQEWLIKNDMEDSLKPFESRNIDGKLLLDLTEEKFISFHDLKIKRRKQIAKCVNECKAQAANAKELFNNIKVVEKCNKSSHKHFEVCQDIPSDDDIWGDDFDDYDDDEEEEDERDMDEEENSEKAEYSLDHNGVSQNDTHENGIQLLGLKILSEEDTLVPQEQPVFKETLNNNEDKTILKTSSIERMIPQPPPLPVITSSTSISSLYPKPFKTKRPIEQPPPPPKSASLSSDTSGMEDYEMPIRTSVVPEVMSSERGVWVACRRDDTHSITSSGKDSDSIDQGTYELIDQEENYETLDDPLQISGVDTSDRPVLPPRTKGSKLLPPPPLPEKPPKFQQHPQPQQVTKTPSMIKMLSQVLVSSNSKKQEQYSKLKEQNRKASLPILFDTKNKEIEPENGEVDSNKVKYNSTTSLARSDSSLSNEDLASRPLPSLPALLTNENSTPQDNLFQQGWFHNITRQEAEIKLRELNEDGGFLVRPSKMAGPNNPYTLSLLYGNSIFNLNIRMRTDGLYALGYEKANEMQFTNISEIINFHRYKPIILTKKNTIAGKTLLNTTPNK